MSDRDSVVGREELPSQTLIDNRYLIKQILGQGGLGRTYLALDTHRFDEPCVLKEFAPMGSGQYDLEKSRSLFKREAQILHQITHPQIPKFLACFAVKKRLFLVQEYVNGKTFSRLLEERQQRQQTFTELEIVRWLMNLLPILDYIHQQGIIHRDISPDNIMQPKGGKIPVLIDFGVGKLTDMDNSVNNPSFRKHSYVGKMSFVGKIGYAPREQISMGRCSPSSDIYALGVTALVLLTGKEPTALVDRLSLEWQWQQYTEVSQNLAVVLSKMTEEKPLRRYQSAGKVLEDLSRRYPSLDRERAIVRSEIPAESTQSTNIYSQPTNPLVETSLIEEIEEETKEDDTIILSPEQTTPKRSNVPDLVSETRIVTGVDTEPPPPIPKAPPARPQNTTPPSVDDTMIVSMASSEPIVQPTVRQTPQKRPPITKSFRPEFMRRFRQELALCIGPIASIVIKDVMEKKKPQTPEELINAVIEYIPDTQQAREFRKRF